MVFRYGNATSLEDFMEKSQVATYEGHRAMFEGYSRNKYTSTGLIQWMLNNAWPQMIWHLYDFYLNQGGAYFGTKKACEPLRIPRKMCCGRLLLINLTFFQAKNEVFGLKKVRLISNNVDFFDIMYSYPDGTVWVINSLYQPASDLVAIASVYTIPDNTQVYNTSVKVASKNSHRYDTCRS